MKDGLKRTAQTDAAGLTPVWLLADEAPQQARILVDRLRASGVAVRSGLGPSSGAPYGAMALLRLDPDIGLATCLRPAVDIDLTLLRPAVRPKGMLLLRPNSGGVTVRQGDRQITAAAREAVLVSGAEPAILRLQAVDRLDCLDLAAQDLDPTTTAAGPALRVIDRDNAALTLLGNYGAALMRGLLPVTTGTLRDLAVRHMAGLVGAMCADPTVVPAGALARRKVSRIATMKADIERRLDERSLTAKRFAELHGVSVRSLQKLFEAEGQTFSQFVLERRLERAMRLLRMPADERQSISEIAFGVGFGDLSYFNRTFRKRFGTAPRFARTTPGVRRSSGASERDR